MRIYFCCIMQRFWYNSPVKFFRVKSDFEDVLNPQNVQLFGTIKPYVLEKGKIHRFLIPEDNNDTDIFDNFSLYVVSGYSKKKIICDVFISDSKIKYITFLCNEDLSGYLQLQYYDDVIYISNCVQFSDTEKSGVRQSRVITRHNYNRQLFDFDPQKAWFVTNLPIYEIGNYGINAEITNERAGDLSTLIPKETYLDEVSRYEIEAKGNPDVLNFLQANVTNCDFYLNGTKRTSTEKIDIDEKNIFGKVSFVNQKDKNGFNITINEDDIFSDLDLTVLNLFPSDNSINAEQIVSDNNNRISITFNKQVNKSLDNSKTAKIYRNGVLVKTKTASELTVLENTLIINDTSLNPSDLTLDIAEYYVLLSSGIVFTDFGKEFQGFSSSSDWNFEISENQTSLSYISWIEGGKQDKTGNSNTVVVTVDTDIPFGDFDYCQWQYFDGDDFVDAEGGFMIQQYEFNTFNGQNQFRCVLIENSGITYISNILKYTKEVAPTLKSVIKLNTNTGRFVWNNNGIDYGLGSCIFQLSTDNGMNWQNFYTANSGSINDDNSIDISSPYLSSLPNNITVKFRIIQSGNGLVNIISNTLDSIWQKTAKIYIPIESIIKNNNGYTQYSLVVEDADFIGFAITRTDIIQNVKRISGDFTHGDDIPLTTQNIVVKSKAITLSPGVYNCAINLSIVQNNYGEYSEGGANISYSMIPTEGGEICGVSALFFINV